MLLHNRTNNSLKNKPRTNRKSEFYKMMLSFPDRLNIMAQGDSWFAYPPKWIINSTPSNLIDHLSKWTKGKTNFFTMASNGAEAVDMMSGKQKHELIDILRWHSKAKNRKPIVCIIIIMITDLHNLIT